MTDLYKVVYRYLNDFVERSTFVPAPTKSKAIHIAKTMFGEIIIVDCYKFN